MGGEDSPVNGWIWPAPERVSEERHKSECPGDKSQDVQRYSHLWVRRGDEVVIEGDNAKLGKIYASVEEVVGRKSNLWIQSAPSCKIS